MTEAIKRMLAERAKLEADEAKAAAALAKSERRWDRIRNVLFARIDRAAPFIDEDCEPGKWPPSKLLKILYLVSATAERPEAAGEAVESVLVLLDVARQRYRAGLNPNPFLHG